MSDANTAPESGAQLPQVEDEGSGWFGFRRVRQLMNRVQEGRAALEQRIEDWREMYENVAFVWSGDPTPAPGLPLPQQDIDFLRQHEHQVEFLEKLGAGGYGQVWRARITLRDPTTGQTRTVESACKLLTITTLSMTLGRAVSMIVKEAELYERLTHPNVMTSDKVIRLYHRSGARYPTRVLVFMPVCQGNLEDLVQSRGLMSEEQALMWFAPIADAVRHLQQDMRISHLDIKDENILYRTSPTNPDEYLFLLSDFGLFVEFGPEELPYFNRTQGTEEFMSPECQRCTSQRFVGQYDAFKSDVWSLGVTLAKCVTGTGVTANPWVRTGEPADTLNGLIDGMLVEDAEQRLSMEQVCDHPLVRQRMNLVGRYNTMY